MIKYKYKCANTNTNTQMQIQIQIHKYNCTNSKQPHHLISPLWSPLFCCALKIHSGGWTESHNLCVIDHSIAFYFICPLYSPHTIYSITSPTQTLVILAANVSFLFKCYYWALQFLLPLRICNRDYNQFVAFVRAIIWKLYTSKETPNQSAESK